MLISSSTEATHPVETTIQNTSTSNENTLSFLVDVDCPWLKFAWTMPRKYRIHSLKMPSSLDSRVNRVNNFDKTKSFLSSFLKKCDSMMIMSGRNTFNCGYKDKFYPYASGCGQSTTQLIKRFIQISGLEDVVNGFCARAAFDRTINAFLKFELSHSIGVVNLSKTSLGNFTICSEYLS